MVLVWANMWAKSRLCKEEFDNHQIGAENLKEPRLVHGRFGFMVNAQLLEEVRSLAPEDRWDLIEALQESLEDDFYEPSAAEADAMLARAEDLRSGRVMPIAWTEVKARLDREFRS